MSDESSLSPGVVRGPDGTQAAVDNDGLSVQSRPIEAILEELLLAQNRMVNALVYLLNDVDRGSHLTIDDLD